MLQFIRFMGHNWQILGHQKQREFLSKSIEIDKIAHAYVFSGLKTW